MCRLVLAGRWRESYGSSNGVARVGERMSLFAACPHPSLHRVVSFGFGRCYKSLPMRRQLLPQTCHRVPPRVHGRS